MNKIPLNIVGLDGGVIIKKGGGGGVTIKNQDKSLEIVENGTTEVTADAGFTGLGKVTIDVNVPTSGGGGSDMPVIGDGKTYLYITIADEANRDVTVNANTSGYNGKITIDWGDGTITEKGGLHTYAEAGDYVITLTVSEGYTLLLGNNTSSSNVLGSTSDDNAAIYNKLRMIEIGTNVSAINSYAFYKCAGLTDVYISDSVTRIGTYAFSYCYALTSLRLPNGAANIENYAFSYCNSLKSLVIPEGVTSIGTYAFADCYSLTSLVIPEGVTSIGNNAFSNCSSLKSLVIPKGVTSFGRNVFSSCYSLASLVISEGVTSIGNNAFKPCTALTSLVISEGVTSIGESAFSGCVSLASLTIPKSVMSFNNYVFQSAYGLKYIDFSQHTEVPTISSDTFYAVVSTCKIIVPDALYDEWKATTNWSSYASKIIKKSDWDASQS